MGLGLVGVILVAIILLYDYTSPSAASHERDHFILVAIIGLVLPVACALVFIFDASVEWLATGTPESFAKRISDDIGKKVWSDSGSSDEFAKAVAQEVVKSLAAGFEVRKFDSAVEFAEFRQKLIMNITSESLDDPIYCTSHLNLFAKPDGNSQPIRDRVAEINKPFFKRLSELSLTEKRGGLRLILQYQDTETDLLEKELTDRLKIFWQAARELNEVDWAEHQFDVTRMRPGMVKDYFVIGDHVLKTIRKTNQSSYMYIRSPEVASSYREWMEDLFLYGHRGVNKTAEKDEVAAIFTRLKAACA